MRRVYVERLASLLPVRGSVGGYSRVQTWETSYKCDPDHSQDSLPSVIFSVHGSLKETRWLENGQGVCDSPHGPYRFYLKLPVRKGDMPPDQIKRGRCIFKPYLERAASASFAVFGEHGKRLIRERA